MAGDQITSIREYGANFSQLVTPTAAILRDTIAYQEDVTAATDETITNVQLSKDNQKDFAGVAGCRLLVVNTGSTNAVDIGYTFTPTVDGSSFTALAGTISSVAAGGAAYADLVSENIVLADGYTLNWTASAETTVNVYLVKLGQS